jgi:UDP-glucose 4-epimerase
LHALVTGGAGFIGSHLVEALINNGHNVTLLDNLSSGHKRNLSGVLGSHNLNFLVGDCRFAPDIKEALKNVDAVFHFAANPEVRLELADPKKCYEQNIKATYVLLERIRKSNVETVVLASSSTIYGDASIIPTPESYGPLKPISVYGASKLACEALVSSYCHSFKKKGIIIRPANIVGPRATHGVMLDFIRKLKANPSKLEILGDGTQTKSYLYINDCIDAIIKVFESTEELVAIYNIGSEDQTNVAEISKIITQEMGLKNVKLKFSGGVEGGRGWIGDVKNMLLDITKLESLGWRPKLNSKQAVRETAKNLIAELQQP